jgi:hypothetical protein
MAFAAGAGVIDGGGGSYKGKRRRDDLVAFTDAGGQQRQVQRAGTGVDGDPLGGAAVLRELLLEVGNVLAKHELCAFENSEDGGINLALDAVVLRLEIQKWNQRNLARATFVDRYADSAPEGPHNAAGGHATNLGLGQTIAGELECWV